MEGVVQATAKGLYADWRTRGVAINFLIHDVLPLMMPNYFPGHVEAAHTKWLCAIAETSDRLICVSQAVADDTERWLRVLKPEVLPSLEIAVSHSGADIDAFHSSTGLPSDAESVLRTLSSRPTFLMVGTVEPRKGHLQTLTAFEQLWSEGLEVNLTVVGTEGWGPEISKTLRGHSEMGRRLFWLEGISDEYLDRVYAASACMVAASEGEGFGLPLVEAARHKLPILARDIPVFREIAGAHASYFSGKDPEGLAYTIKDWLALRAQNRHSKSDDMPWLTWAQSAERLKRILLDYDVSAGGTRLDRTIEEAGSVAHRHGAVGRNGRDGLSRVGARQLLVDVSAIARVDLKTGIQRVVKAQLLALLNNPPPGFRVEPVWLCHQQGQWRYCYARRYMAGLLSLPEAFPDDDPVEVAGDDIFFSPDFFAEGVVHARAVFADWSARGVEINFMVYDLLPLLLPQYFPVFAEATHAKWLGAAAESSDRLICISSAVAEDARRWLKAHRPETLRDLEITVSHLGADIESFAGSKGMPAEAGSILERLSSRPSFLMVGTIEPRKGHLQAVAAFERLWNEGLEANLVIVGPEGWGPVPVDLRRNIPEIVKALRNHPELGKSLFWLEGISDEYLEKVYATSVCLIAASENEGLASRLSRPPGTSCRFWPGTFRCSARSRANTQAISAAELRKTSRVPSKIGLRSLPKAATRDPTTCPGSPGRKALSV